MDRLHCVRDRKDLGVQQAWVLSRVSCCCGASCTGNPCETKRVLIGKFELPRLAGIKEIEAEMAKTQKNKVGHSINILTILPAKSTADDSWRHISHMQAIEH